MTMRLGRSANCSPALPGGYLPTGVITPASCSLPTSLIASLSAYFDPLSAQAHTQLSEEAVRIGLGSTWHQKTSCTLGLS